MKFFSFFWWLPYANAIFLVKLMGPLNQIFWFALLLIPSSKHDLLQLHGVSPSSSGNFLSSFERFWRNRRACVCMCTLSTWQRKMVALFEKNVYDSIIQWCNADGCIPICILMLVQWYFRLIINFLENNKHILKIFFTIFYVLINPTAH